MKVEKKSELNIKALALNKVALNNLEFNMPAVKTRTLNSREVDNTCDFELCIQEVQETKEKQATETPKTNKIDNKEQKTEKKYKTDTENIEKLKKLLQDENTAVKIPQLTEILRDIEKNHSFSSDEEKSLKLDKKDIEFFISLLEIQNQSNNLTNPGNARGVLIPQGQDFQGLYKSLNISKGLSELIEYSYKSQKPVRLDFGADSSVILKISSKGMLTAEFMSNDKAMEYILKSSIPILKEKFNAENLPYEDILYKENKENRKNKKEKENERGDK